MKKLLMIMATVMLLLAACGGKKVDEETANLYKGKAEEVMHFLNEGDVEGVQAMLDDNMKAALTADQLSEVIGIVKESGEFEQVDKSSVEEQNGNFVTVLAVKYSKQSRVYTITFNGQQEVAGLYIK